MPKKILTPKQKKQLREVFAKEGVVLAYLFGSRATRQPNQESDFDIAVYLSPRISREKLFDKRLKLIAEVSRALKTDDLDLVVINTLRSPFFKFVIIKEGELILEDDPDLRVDLELRIIQDYQDYKPIMEMYDQRLLNSKL